jgi:HEAT repeat protein
MKRWMQGALALVVLAGGLRADEAGVLKDLKFGTAEKREAALDEVMAGKAPGAGKALLQVLSESQGTFRLRVVRALGLVREDAAVRPLIELLADPAIEIRTQAAKSLGSIADPAAAPALAKALGDSDVEVREAAARALSACGSAKDVDALKPLLKDGNRLVRMAAIGSIGRLGTASALPLLQEQMQDTDPSYKRVVVKAIGTLKGGADIDASMAQWLADKDFYLRGFTAEALAQRPANKALEPALIRLLADPNLGVRIRAIEALAAWKSKAAVPELLKDLRAEEPTLRWKATQALGSIGDPSSREALTYVAQNDSEAEIKKAAATALLAFKGGR